MDESKKNKKISLQDIDEYDLQDVNDFHILGKTKSNFSLQDVLKFDKNVFIGFGLLIFAIYLINILTRPEISQDIQGFLVVIIGLLLIVAIDFFKKASNYTSSNLQVPYPTIENNYYYNYNGENVYHNTVNTYYSSKENLQKVATEIKEIIETVSQNITDLDVEEMQIIEAELIEKIKHNEPEITKDLTAKDLSIVAKTIERMEQDQPLKQRVIGALKAGGHESLLELTDNPLVATAISSIKGWMENKTDINN
ncbi:hypothetical protein [Crocosphaera sp.]|uniref:hypothetical protein n=1 Tax=Crocosphaera sp. TaxID=2729996 RepID=UPI00260A7653|nr:hypothetical protein [Crocosphaera sp.]MDJ0578383.1 hypothetical protein [Crocosphaera sp.]